MEIRLISPILLSFLRMSAEMTLTTSLMPDYRYRRIRFILFLHLNTDSDHSRVEKHGDLFCWDSATASFAVWGILTIHWKISSTVLGLRGFYHLQRWHRLSRSVCGLSSNNEQLLLLIFTRADRYPGLSEETYLMLLLFVMVVTFRHTNAGPFNWNWSGLLVFQCLPAKFWLDDLAWYESKII